VTSTFTAGATSCHAPTEGSVAAPLAGDQTTDDEVAGPELESLGHRAAVVGSSVSVERVTSFYKTAHRVHEAQSCSASGSQDVTLEAAPNRLIESTNGPA